MNEEEYEELLQRMVEAMGELEDISMELDRLRIDDMENKDLELAQKAAYESFNVVDTFFDSIDFFEEAQ